MTVSLGTASDSDCDSKAGKRFVDALVLFSALLILLFTAGCRSGSDTSSVIKLTYWSATNPYEIQLAEQLTSEWNEAHPGVQVKLQPLPEGRSGEEVLIVAAAGGTTPDICSNVPPVIVPLLANAGVLIPVDNFADGREFMSNRLPDGLETTFTGGDGKLYQIPWKGNPIMVQYNVGLLRQWGVTKLPMTWSEWNEAALQIKQDFDGDGHPDQWMADIQVESEWRRRLFDLYTFYIAASDGGTLLENGRVGFENETMTAVFQFFAEGFKEEWYPKTVLPGDQFLQGRFAAHVTGPWNISHTERLKPDGFEYAFGPIPIPDGKDASTYTFGDPKSIGIFSTCEHPEEAWDFVKFIISRRSDHLLLEITNQLPLRRDLLTDTLYTPYFEANPMMTPFAEKVPTTVGFDQNTALQEVFDIVSDAFDAASIHNARDPQEAIKLAAERASNVLHARGGG